MIESKEHKEALNQIAKKLEYKSQSYPKNENGEPTETYLEYLSLMYESKIARIVKELPVFPNMLSVVKLSKIVDIDKTSLSEMLEEPSKRGFIINIGRQYAQPMPLFIYDMPFILKTNYEGHKEDAIKFAELSHHFYEKEGYYKTWQNSRNGIPRMRVLTVSEEIEPEKEILPIEEVYSVIDKWEDFAVIPCPCRMRAELEGNRECKNKYPIHNCILLGPNAKAVLEMGDPIIKEVSKEEIKKITREAAEIGLVHCTDNDAENTSILCACCECCCGMLKGLTRLDNPRAVAKANFLSKIDKDLCVACGTCLERCKFDAITLDEHAIVNSDKCVGCGLCAVTCPEKAITMIRFERETIPRR